MGDAEAAAVSKVKKTNASGASAANSSANGATSNPLVGSVAAAASLQSSNGVTNPLLPRSLGRLGIGRPKSTVVGEPPGVQDQPKQPFKSRFLGKRLEKTPPSPDSGVASPPSLVNRSSSGSSSTSTTSNNSSGYCTYSNENGLLKFTIQERAEPKEEIGGARGRSMSGAMGSALEKSKSRILIEEEEKDFVPEPIRLPNQPLTDLTRRNSKGERRSVDRQIGGASSSGNSSAEPDRLSKAISAFMKRSDERISDWRSYERQRAAGMGGTFGTSGIGSSSTSFSPSAAPMRAQSVARATSVDRDDDLYKRISYPQKSFGENRNRRAASIARDDIFNEYQSVNLRRPMVRGASVARDDVSNEYFSSIREGLYNATGSRFLRGSPSRDRSTPLRDTASSVRERTTPLRETSSSVRERTTPLRETASSARERTTPLRDFGSSLLDSGVGSSRMASRMRSPLRDDFSGRSSNYLMPNSGDRYSKTRSPIRDISESSLAMGRRSQAREDPDISSRSSVPPRYFSRLTPMRDSIGERRTNYDDDYSLSVRRTTRGASVARDSGVANDFLGRDASRNFRSQSVVPSRPSIQLSRDPYDQAVLPDDHFTRAGIADSYEFRSYREPAPSSNYYSRSRAPIDDEATIRAPPPKFLSLEEECNWILSGRYPAPQQVQSQLQPSPPKSRPQMHYLQPPNPQPRRRKSRNNDTLNDLLSQTAGGSDDEDTLDDISGDEVVNGGYVFVVQAKQFSYVVARTRPQFSRCAGPL